MSNVKMTNWTPSFTYVGGSQIVIWVSSHLLQNVNCLFWLPCIPFSLSSDNLVILYIIWWFSLTVYLIKYQYCKRKWGLHHFFIILLNSGEIGLLCTLNAYDFYWLYYSLSTGNVYEALEDQNRIEEIRGKSKFPLTVVFSFYVYISLLVSQIFVSSLYTWNIHIKEASRFVTLLKNNTPHFQNTLVALKTGNNSASIMISIFYRGIKHIKQRL